MPRGWLWSDLLTLSIVMALFTFLSGCAISGTVTDRSRSETVINRIDSKSGDGLKMYYGGAIRTVPLSNISSVEIDPRVSTVYNGELYYKVTVVLRDGTSIKSSGNRNTENITNVPFLSVQNSLIGKNGKDLFEIGLESVSKIVLTK